MTKKKSQTAPRPLILCLDFDGVLHSYTSGWKGIDQIPDPPVTGAMEALVSYLLDDRLEVHVYSSRSREAKGIDAMRKWIAHHLSVHYRDAMLMRSTDYSDQLMARLHFATEKPPAHLTIDDRAMAFTGTFPSSVDVRHFVPWNKRGERHQLCEIAFELWEIRKRVDAFVYDLPLGILRITGTTASELLDNVAGLLTHLGSELTKREAAAKKKAARK